MNFIWRVKAVLSTDLFSNSFTVAAITSWQWLPAIQYLSTLAGLLLPPLGLLIAIVTLVIKLQVLRGRRPRIDDDFE